MAKRHVFLSFVVEDLDLVNMFRGQAKNKNSELEFDDYSVKKPYDSKDADYIKSQISEKIRACSTTICLFGETTYKSPWITWEIEKSDKLGKKVIGVRLHSSSTKDVAPKVLTDLKAKILDWNIDAIVAEL